MFRQAETMDNEGRRGSAPDYRTLLFCKPCASSVRPREERALIAPQREGAEIRCLRLLPKIEALAGWQVACCRFGGRRA